MALVVAGWPMTMALVMAARWPMIMALAVIDRRTIFFCVPVLLSSAV
jgi:hypothetical protein